MFRKLIKYKFTIGMSNFVKIRKLILQIDFGIGLSFWFLSVLTPKLYLINYLYLNQNYSTTMSIIFIKSEN